MLVNLVNQINKIRYTEYLVFSSVHIRLTQSMRTLFWGSMPCATAKRLHPTSGVRARERTPVISTPAI